MKLVRGFLAAVSICSFLAASPVQTVAQQAPVLRYIGFSPLAPGDRLECRLAIAYALNREAIASASNAARDGGGPAYSIQSPRLPGYDATIRWPAYDPAKAKEYWAQCAWLGALVISASPFSNDFLRALGQAIQESLRTALGVQVSIDQVEPSNLVAQIIAGRVPIYSIGWRAVPQDFGYPSIPLGLAEGIRDPEVRELVSKRDGPGVERMLLQKMLFIPLLIF